MNTEISLKPEEYAFVFDHAGNLQNIYLPQDESTIVPDIVVEIIELAIGNKKQ